MRRDLAWTAVAAVAFLAVTGWLAAGSTSGIATRGGMAGALVGLDLSVAEWCAAHRPPAADAAARVLNRLGQGLWLLGICAGLAGWLGWLRWRARRRWWPSVEPLLYVAAAAALAVPGVLAIKRLTGRGAPSSDLPPELTAALPGDLPIDEYAAGYPGGHALNAVVWYGVLLVLVTALLRELDRSGPAPGVRLVVRLVPPVVVLATTTYLSFHWLTDGLAGLAFGLLVDRLLALLRRSVPAARDPGSGAAGSRPGTALGQGSEMPLL